MKRRTRILLYCTGGVFGLAVLAAALVVLWLRGSLPMTSGTVELAGLTGKVEIIRDTDGVPHIFADAENDAMFALGYVHAQDRLWQMETMRRVGAGRLSEITGPETLRIDRFVRTFGLYRLAERQAAALTGAARHLSDAYTKGVNAFLTSHDGPLPPEFFLLGHRPEPWRTADSVVWARVMALQLSKNWRTELLRLRLTKRLTPEQIDDLWPGDGPDGPVTLPATANAPAKATTLQLEKVWAALPDALAPVDASNAWVLDGSRTASGKPILANDPHLGFTKPVLWYLARIETPTLSLTGATVPGVPLLVLGHNTHIAWGMTTTGGDVEDLYLERLDPKDPTRYLTPDGPRAFETRVERIGVKDQEPVELTVRETRHGPVISDIAGSAGDGHSDTHVLAVAAPSLRPDDRTAAALFAINRAKNWQDFTAATRDFHAPQQNLFYADTGGGIGMITPGRVPVRAGHDGGRPANGEDASHDWNGFVSADAVPSVRNPDAGFIMNANNRLVGDGHPHRLARDWDAPFRAERLLEILPGARAHAMADSAALQMDILSPAARRLVPFLTNFAPETDRQKAALALLRAWDFRMRRDRPEPQIYAAWLHDIMRALAADELGPLFKDYRRPRSRFILNVLQNRPRWCDDVTTERAETCAETLRAALDKTLDRLTADHGDDMAGWRWGARHRAYFPNRFFAAIPVIGDLASTKIETDGGDHTVNRGQTVRRGNNRHSHTHGAGLRAVYDLADLANSRFMIGTGQSGNPFSPHYGDLTARWRDGKHLTIGGNRDEVRARAAGILTLVPKFELRP
ncbi:MAG: penicillin acylase family protein [Alphaproteobacteria bacterium]|nr:penicillin acylase family protein [Alphaproteobacteria bacterium]